MAVHVTRRAARARTPTSAAVRARAERMLEGLGLAGAELSVVLTNDATIHALNREHRKKDKPTDVLAFPMDGAQAGPGGRVHLLGDVVISLDTAARQAPEHGHDLPAEVVHLLAHGVLHLVGWDHRTDAEERRMNREAARLIALATGDATRAPQAARRRRPAPRRPIARRPRRPR